jgi:hypothetical protein
VRRREENGPQYEIWGCDYCADPNNHLFGHLDQICDSSGGAVLMRCPLCKSIYEPSGRGDDEFRRLSEDDAANVLPLNQWTVIPGDP